MTNQLATIEPQTNMPATLSFNGGVELSQTQKKIANELRGLSLAVNPSFPIPNIMLAEYAIILEDEHPNLTPTILKKIIRQIQTGKLPYEQNKGVRALFEAIEKYKELRKHYYLFNVDTAETQIVNEDSTLDVLDTSTWFVFNVRLNGLYNPNGTIPQLPDGFRFIDDQRKREREACIRYHQREGKPLPSFHEWLKTKDKN